MLGCLVALSSLDNAVTWVSDNRMVISPDKTKMIISMTKELRATRHPNISISVSVNGTNITATSSEKLLGVIISQDLSWAPHLWGETWRPKGNHPGLIPTLIQRLALLRHLSRFSSRAKMKAFLPAMISSKIRYALPLIGSVWGLGGYSAQEPQKVAFTKHDMTRLQSIQRSAIMMTLPPSPDMQHKPTI